VVYELQLYDKHSMKKCGIETKPVFGALCDCVANKRSDGWGRIST